MRESWLELLACVLRPARPRQPTCLQLRERMQLREEVRERALRRCVAEIESARAKVFAAMDGYVPVRMTELEREWRRLARRDPEAGMMDLWARIAPAAWIDRKRWRDSDVEQRVDAAVALASDPDGVEAAELAMAQLRAALVPLGTRIGAHVRWRMSQRDYEGTDALLAGPLAMASRSFSSRTRELVAVERAEALRRDVEAAAVARFPHRPHLTAAIARAALVDAIILAARTQRPNPVDALRSLWTRGYVISELGEEGVTLEIPPLSV